MSNSISKIYEEYELYVLLCNKIGELTKNISEDFSTHEEKLLKKYSYKKVYYGYEKINK